MKNTNVCMFNGLTDFSTGSITSYFARYIKSYQNLGLMAVVLVLGLSLGTDLYAEEGRVGDSDRMEPVSAADLPEASEFTKPAPKPTPVRKTFTKAERKYICDTYNGKYISYYGTIYFVKNCTRRILVGSDIFRLTRDEKKIFEVDQDAIIALHQGSPFNYRETFSKVRTCQEFDGRYVTFKFGDLFYVKRCVKRVFQDWGSFETHRVKISSANSEVLSLTWAEFSSLREGQPMPSIIAKENVLAGGIQSSVDIIPLDEACEGIDGKFVSYYSKIYKIEKCRKRKFEPVAFSKQYGYRESRVRELTSEQWISIPNGPPM